jgi:hypothetical protein
MEEEDIEEVKQVLVDVKTIKKEAFHYDPAIEVEHSIVSLLRHRIEKLQDDVNFEASIKEAILARLPEAEFSELIRILDTIQANTNVSVEKILSPFIPRVGERVPLLDGEKKEKRAAEDDFNDSATREDMEAIRELGKVMKLVREKQQQKKLEIEKKESQE